MKSLLKLIPYGRQAIDDADIAAVVEVLRGDYLTQGPAIPEFEAALAAYTGASHAVAVSNGTAALHIAYLALGVGKGDAVIVPSLTFAATANAALYVGATPVFADINPATLGLDVNSVMKAHELATRSGLRPKAVAVVHFSGMPAEIGALKEFANRTGMFIIEDSCHALGAEYKLSAHESFSRVGSSEFSDVSVFSFHPVKHITTGEGGALTTRNKDLAYLISKLRTHGITKATSEMRNKDRSLDHVSGSPNPWYYEMQALGYNYRLCDIQAALGSSQLKKIEANIVRRREIAERYRRGFASIPSLNLPPADSDVAKNSYHLFPVRIDYRALKKSRFQVMAELKELGVGSQVHYLPVFQHPYYQENLALWLNAESTQSEEFYESALSLPIFPSLSEGELQQVIVAVATVIK